VFKENLSKLLIFYMHLQSNTGTKIRDQLSYMQVVPASTCFSATDVRILSIINVRTVKGTNNNQ